jgi:hypothetical protein
MSSRVSPQGARDVLVAIGRRHLGDAVKASRTGSTQDDGFQGGQAEIRERGGAFGRLSNTKEYPSSDDYDQVMKIFLSRE